MINTIYYKSQSQITNIVEHKSFINDLNESHDIKYVCAVVQGLLLHINDGQLFNFQIHDSRKSEINLRHANKILDKIIHFDSSPIINIRNIEHRVIATCRDFAVLACAILRNFAIPARVRYGFSKYYYTQFYHDIVLLEYWDRAKNKWCFVDVRTTAAQIHGHKFQVDFDIYDIPRDQFILASTAWKKCRQREIKATKFGSGKMRDIKGLWYVRNKLIQDLASLNKHEMLPWDCWGYMLHNKAGVDPYDALELETLDQVANIIDDHSIIVQEIKDLYKNHNLQVSLCCL